MSGAAFDAGARAGLVKAAAQTRGEFEAATSASGLGATAHGVHDTAEAVVRNPGNARRGRGAPAWVRAIHRLRSSATTGGGDKIGPETTDNQFESTYREQETSR